VFKAPLAYRVLLAYRVQQDLQVWVSLVLQAFKAPLAYRVLLVPLVSMVPLAFKAPLELLVLMVLPECKALQGLQA
jgi:hypothetical protein